MMRIVFKTIYDIIASKYCCSKKALNENSTKYHGTPFSDLNIMFIIIYHYFMLMNVSFILVSTNIIPLCVLYCFSYYLPIWVIVYISNTITMTVMFSILCQIKEMVKDMKCVCSNNNIQLNTEEMINAVETNNISNDNNNQIMNHGENSLINELIETHNSNDKKNN